MFEYRDFKVFWDGHASVRIEDNGFTVAVDPFEKSEADFDSDIVLITHRDAGHFDPERIEQVCKDNTCVVVPESIDIEEVPCEDVECISEGQTIDIFGIEIEATPMYNEFHERGQGVGYRFKMRNTGFFVAGDTGLIEEFFDLENLVDLAFLPIEGEYTMSVSDAVKAAVRIKPDVVIPYHYGKPFFGGKNVDLNGLRAELEDRNIRCEVLESENS